MIRFKKEDKHTTVTCLVKGRYVAKMGIIEGKYYIPREGVYHEPDELLMIARYMETNRNE